MAYDFPQLEETCQRLNVERDSSFERRNTGFGTDAIVQEGDKSKIDSEEERETVNACSLKELMRVEEEASAGRGDTTHTLQETEKRPYLCKGKNIITEVQGDTDKAPVEVILLDDSDDEVAIEITHSQDQEPTEKIRPCLDG